MVDFSSERIRDLVVAAANVAGQIDLSSLLHSTVTTAVELTGARYGALGVLGEHGTLVDFVHVGMSPEDAARISHFPRGDGVLGTITRRAETVRLEDVADHPDSVGFPEHHPAMHSFLGVPVRVGDRVFGNLYLTEKEGGFTDADQTLVEFLAVTAGAAVSTIRLQQRLRRAALQEDRERIARDLHDSIIQDLFALGLDLQRASGQVRSEPESVEQRLASGVDRLDDAIASLRRYIFDLRPPLWARPEMDVELRRLVTDISAPYGIAVGVEVDCPPQVPEPPLSDHVLAVVKETVSNALRHARASSIDVRVACDGSRLLISVVDDGVGFDPSVQYGGLGLPNLVRRVNVVGGEYKLDSAPGKGTVVMVSLPLSASGADPTGSE
ncbi:MAG: GAF domain-containing sensor histidine kinase [Acidimicrobiia bacterium]|nr:MAG: GAF domain-containing sensor histidine kinase [Acidimicrobiia bacterium]